MRGVDCFGAGSRVGGDQGVGHAYAAGCGDGVSEHSRAGSRDGGRARERGREREGGKQSGRVGRGVGVVAMEGYGSWEAAAAAAAGAEGR